MLKVSATGVLVVAFLMAPALAVPSSPSFGPGIDDLAGYDGQSICSPTDKPGVVAFKQRVLAAYPGTGAGGISRACHIGGTSEHKEGRAWDWMVDASDPADRAKADEVIEWLLREDKYGNDHAMARRLGIMYLIWNRRSWSTWGGWESYCTSSTGCSPHTDHVHFSFSWAGALKRRTFWHPQQSMVAAMDAVPSKEGYWMAGRNGFMRSSAGAGSLGSPGSGYLRVPIVGVASTPSGAGYWLVNRSGRVFAYGDARSRGSIPTDEEVTVASIAATPTGNGYWIVGHRGRVFVFGDATHYGDLRGGEETIAAVTPSPSGRGYWLTSASGHVTPFGNARFFGDFVTDSRFGGMERTPSGAGYWLVTEGGRVVAYGDARHYGDLRAVDLSSPVVGIAATPSGLGYWLVTAHGGVRAYGDAAGTSGARWAPSFSPRTPSAPSTGFVLPG